MTVLLAYIRTPEGDAALDEALEEARRRSTDAVVVNVTRPEPEVASPFSAEQSLDAVAARFASAGITVDVLNSPMTGIPATRSFGSSRTRHRRSS